MQKVKVVSGYVPLDGIVNVSKARFLVLGEELANALPCPYRMFHDEREDCWMYKFIRSQHYEVTSTDPNPDPARFANPQAKVLSNCVMHQKMEWMALAALEDPEPNTFIWIDYGVLKQEGMDQQVVTDFIKRVVENSPLQITAPGVRTTIDKPDPAQSWDRFCGSVVIVPRHMLFDLHQNMKRRAMEFVEQTHQVTIESNTLAEIEYYKIMPINWYQAWWGRSMFESYR